jgi:hypothetical protein
MSQGSRQKAEGSEAARQRETVRPFDCREGRKRSVVSGGPGFRGGFRVQWRLGQPAARPTEETVRRFGRGG